MMPGADQDHVGCVGLGRHGSAPAGQASGELAVNGSAAPVGEHHIGAPPRLVADQPPRVAGAGVVLRQQDVAGADGEALAARLRLELQRAARG